MEPEASPLKFRACGEKVDTRDLKSLTRKGM